MPRLLAALTVSLAMTLPACAGGEPAAGCVDGVWQGNVTAEDLDAVRGCPHVAGNVYLWDAPVASFESLASLQTVSGALSILGSHNLTDLSGLEALTELGGCFEIIDNAQLTDLRGAEHLQRVGCLIIGRAASSGAVYGNPKLTSLDGLNGLEQVEDTLIIAHNPNLVAVSALAGLEHLGGRELVIASNAKLPTCSAELLAEQLSQRGYDGEVLISGNDEEAVCHR